MMKLIDTRNATFLADGRIACEINHPAHGWMPFTADPKDDEPLGQEVHALLKDSGKVAAFIPPALGLLKAAALSQVDAAHANYLRLLTGSASPEERDTWTVKDEAATAFLAGTATDAQKAMIEAEAAGGGITPTQLAQTIKAKATGFLMLVGQASGIRAQGRAAIKAASTHAELQAALDALEAQASAAAKALAGGQS